MRDAETEAKIKHLMGSDPTIFIVSFLYGACALKVRIVVRAGTFRTVPTRDTAKLSQTGVPHLSLHCSSEYCPTASAVSRVDRQQEALSSPFVC